MAAINLPFGASAPKRVPDSTELAGGYGCGPADIELFNWLAWYFSGQLSNIAAKSGLTADDTDLTQILKAIRSQAANYRVAGGTANALTVTLDPPLTAYVAGIPLRVLTGASANSGAMTVNVDGLGAVALVNRDGTPISSGQIAADSLLEIVSAAGPTWRVMNLIPSYEASRVAFPTITTYTTPGTYTFTPPANVKKVRVRVWGGGGSGGTSQATIAGGGGGAAGGYAEKVCDVTPGVGITVTVGAGGAAPGNGVVSGGATGGTSSFGVLCSATGGPGGNACVTSTPGTPTATPGGIGVGGDLNLQGTGGGSGASGTNSIGGFTGYGGLGGSAPLGGAGAYMSTGSAGPGGFPGGGGSGGGSAAGINSSGGPGGAGCVIVEYVG